jgi:hypothetical protein
MKRKRTNNSQLASTAAQVSVSRSTQYRQNKRTRAVLTDDFEFNSDAPTEGTVKNYFFNF